MFEDENDIPVPSETVSAKRERLSPFEFVKSITETKHDIFAGNEDTYNQFLINKSLSFNPDCIFFVHQVAFEDIPDRAHYLYLLNSISKKRRYGGWEKKDTLPESVLLIKEAYGYSTKDALIALDLLSDKHLLELKDVTRKGGRR